MVKKGVLSPAATKEFGIMTSDSIELSQVIAKKSRDPHRKRLDSRRLKSPNQTKRLNDNKEIDSRESKTDDSSFSSSASSSSSDVSSVIMAGKCERCRKSVESKTVTCETYGTISVIGRRREMEDTVKVALDFLTLAEDKDTNRMRYDFYAVYDGHGGSRVAHACRDKLHRVLAEEVGVTETGKEGGGVDWEKVMVVSFGKVDDDVNRSFGNATAVSSLSSANTIGSTAVVAVVGKDKVVVGNCGDSRAVLCRGGVAIALSNDHKPDRPDELERVEALGGRVINWNGHRVLGVLATSRSIGDGYLKPFVISNPEVLVSERTDKDEFLILASDGLWDVISNEVACKVVRRCLDGRMRRRCQEPVRDKSLNGSGRAAEAAAVLATLAMARGSKDNISIIVVELRKCGGGLGC